MSSRGVAVDYPSRPYAQQQAGLPRHASPATIGACMVLVRRWTRVWVVQPADHRGGVLHVRGMLQMLTPCSAPGRSWALLCRGGRCHARLSSPGMSTCASATHAASCWSSLRGSECTPASMNCSSASGAPGHHHPWGYCSSCWNARQSNAPLPFLAWELAHMLLLHAGQIADDTPGGLASSSFFLHALSRACPGTARLQDCMEADAPCLPTESGMVLSLSSRVIHHPELHAAASPLDALQGRAPQRLTQYRDPYNFLGFSGTAQGVLRAGALPRLHCPQDDTQDQQAAEAATAAAAAAACSGAGALRRSRGAACLSAGPSLSDRLEMLKVEDRRQLGRG